MAIITVTSNGILTPETLGEYPFGGLLSATPQSVVVCNLPRYSSTSYTGVYSGTFTTNIAGDITGTVTGFSFGYKTTPFLTITGLSVNATQLFAMVGTGNVQGLTDLFFAGNDVINAQNYQATYGPGQIVNGLAGNDLVYGSRGTDDLRGGVGQDTLYGALSHDTLMGEAGDDLLYGESGNDFLQGGAGRDLLAGGWDADTLVGGVGADQLYGGLGADLFIWTNLQDSRVGGANRDTVQDFLATDGDRIDLSALDAKAGVKGNQAFVWVEAFDGLAGALRVQSTAQGCVILADTNGDNAADFAVDIFGTATVSAADFIL